MEYDTWALKLEREHQARMKEFYRGLPRLAFLLMLLGFEMRSNFFGQLLVSLFK